MSATLTLKYRLLDQLLRLKFLAIFVGYSRSQAFNVCVATQKIGSRPVYRGPP